MTIGITGHQLLSTYDTNWIINCIDDFLKLSKATKGYSSLAVGSDQLFVQLLINNNVPYDAIIPCENYDLTFKSEEDLAKYQLLLKGADDIIKLNFPKPTEQAFYEAGKRVVELSNCLVAVWNGERAKGLGGTADIVEYAKKRGKKTFYINPVTQIQAILNYD
jgi:hypothetical protein